MGMRPGPATPTQTAYLRNVRRDVAGQGSAAGRLDYPQFTERLAGSQ
jgi:hypothetical protein